jgi:WD40 repeat protein
LVTGSRDDTARVWDLSDLATTSIVLHGHERDITSIAISPDSRWLVTGSQDSTARVWDLTAISPPGRGRGGFAITSVILPDHDQEITTVAMSADNRWLATGSRDSTARLWMLQLDELIDLACRTTGRNLSPAEWNQYFQGEEYRQTCPDLPLH